MKISKAIGINLRRLRLSHYAFSEVMSQKDLAKKAKVSQSTITQIECGDKLPSLTTLYRIAGALEVDVCDLLSPKGARRE